MVARNRLKSLLHGVLLDGSTVFRKWLVLLTLRPQRWCPPYPYALRAPLGPGASASGSPAQPDQHRPDRRGRCAAGCRRGRHDGEQGWQARWVRSANEASTWMPTASRSRPPCLACKPRFRRRCRRSAPPAWSAITPSPVHLFIACQLSTSLAGRRAMDHEP
jgi:hypothetical protein